MRILSLSILSFILSISGALALTVESIKKDKGRFFVNDIYALPDPTNALSLTEVINQIDDFKLLEHYKLPKDHVPTWLYFDIKNEGDFPTELILSFEHLRLNRVTLYEQNNSSTPLYDTGLDLPASTRPLDYSILALPLHIDANTEKRYYIKVENYLHTFFFPYLSGPAGFNQHIIGHTAISYITLGIVIGVTLYLMLIAWMTRDLGRNQVHIAYLACHSLILALLTLDSWAIFDIERVYSYLFFGLIFLLSPMFVETSRQLLESARNTPNIDKWLKRYIFFHFLAAPMILFSPIDKILIIVSSIGAVSLNLINIYSYFAVYKKINFARYYALMFTGYTLGLGLWTAVAYGLISINPWTVHLYEITTCYLAFSLAVVMVKRMYDDRDEKKRLILEATLANKMNAAKGNFLAVMSHEIRTPINGVLGMAEILSQTKLNKEQESYNNLVISSGQNLLRVLNDILDFSRIDAGKMPIESQPFYLGKLLAESYALYFPLAEKKGVNLYVSYSPSADLHLIGDSGRIQQVLHNLISNAIKFTDHGKIAIFAHAQQLDEHQVTLFLKVTDTGIGLEKKQVESLFNPFTQGDSSINRRFGGTGLGLSISQALLALMKGSINVKSELGQGADFCVTLPLKIDQRKQVKYQQSKSIHNNLTITLFDQSNINNGSIESHLTANHYRVNRLRNIRQLNKLLEQSDLLIINGHAINTSELTQLTSLSAPAHNLIYLAPINSGKQLNTLPSLCQILYGGIDIAEIIACINKIVHSKAPLVEQKTSREEVPTYSDCYVLIVEDNPVNAKVAEKQLQSLGVNTKVVDNGQQAINYFKRNPQVFDLILMDCEMPGIDGYLATRKIRDHEKEKKLTKTPIIALTAHVVDTFQQRCFDAGMDDIITKPLAKNTLSQLLQQWIHNTPQRKKVKSMAK